MEKEAFHSNAVDGLLIREMGPRKYEIKYPADRSADGEDEEKPGTSAENKTDVNVEIEEGPMDLVFAAPGVLSAIQRANGKKGKSTVAVSVFMDGGGEGNARDACYEKSDVNFKCLFTCLFESCSYSAKTSGILEQHMRMDHLAEESLICAVCKTSFDSIDASLAHIRMFRENTLKECCACGKIFPRSPELISHVRTHTGEKPYACRFCGLCFAQHAAVVVHTRIHTGELPYECKHCGKKVREKGQLNRHEKTHLGERPYSCGLCDRHFAHERSLEHHMLSHTGERPFECDVCSNTFKDVNALRRHFRLHTGEKPYKCEKKGCEKAFALKSALDEHHRTHSGERAFACKLCEARFVHRSGYYAHMRKHREKEAEERAEEEEET